MHFRRLACSVLIACAPFASAQELVPEQVIEITLKSNDPALAGHGPSRTFEFAAKFAGTLHLWASSSDFDPILWITDSSGKLLKEDDDSGGGTTAYFALEVALDQALSIVVAADASDAAGKLALHVSESPETDATRAAALLGHEHLAEAERLRDSKSLREARELLAQAVGELLAVEGAATSALVERATDQLGFLAQTIGAAAVAREAWLARLQQCERTLSRDHSELQRARGNLAEMLRALGDPLAARALQEQVLEVRSRTLPNDHPELQSARRRLAVTLHVLGDLPGARTLFQKVLEVRERTLPGDDADLQWARMNLAMTLYTLGELAQARALQEKVVEVLSRTLPEDHGQLQTALGDLAVTLDSLGDLPAARELQEKVLEVSSRTLPDDHGDLQIARENLALTLRALGQLPAARALQEQVLEVRTGALPDDHPDLQAARGNLAATLYALGDVAAARALQEKLFEISSRKLHDDHVHLQAARGNLSVMLVTLGDLPAARVLQEKVLEVRSRILPEEHPSLLATRLRLASILERQGDLAGARALEKEVLEIRLEALPDDHPDLQEARHRVALTLKDAGDFRAARVLLEKVLEVYSRTLPADHAELRSARRNLAWLCAEQGDDASLAPLLADLARSLQASLDSSLAASSREAGERIAALAHEISTLLTLSKSSAALEPAIFGVIETGRDRAVPSALARAGADPKVHQAARESRELRGRIQDLVAASGETEHGTADRSESISDLVRRRDIVEAEFRRVLVERGLVAPPIEVGRVVSALPEHAAAAGVWRYTHWTYSAEDAANTTTAEQRLVAFVVTRSGALKRVELGSVDEIAAAVRRWRVAVGQPLERGISVESALDDERAAGEALRALVLDPLLAAAGEVEALHICLDDALHLVPLDSLPMGEGLVGDRVQVHVEASFGRLLRRTERTEGDPSLLAIGGADFNAAAQPASSDRAGPLGLNLAPLAQTRAEAANLGELFRNVFEREPTVLTGKQATKAALVDKAFEARFVHIATHGYFAPESVKSLADPHAADSLFKRMTLEETVIGLAPMTLCGLALAGANRGVDALGSVPGIITAEEIAGLDLSNCELAVLSACETNVGITRAGQGTQSLQAALHAAGARTAITSLWKVDDEATRELFEGFYTRIWVKHEPKSEALWAAKMALRKQGRPTREWAAWVLTGEPD